MIISYLCKDFGRGLLGGLTGIVTQPIKGAKEEGVLGFGKGIGKGLLGHFKKKITPLGYEKSPLTKKKKSASSNHKLGVVVKPTSGALDLVTRTMQGVHAHTADPEKLRSRYPRQFSEDDDGLEPYDPKMAESQTAVSQHFNNEKVLFVLERMEKFMKARYLFFVFEAVKNVKNVNVTHRY